MGTHFKVSESGKNMPIRLFHGRDDPVVRYEFGRKSLDYLKSEGGVTDVTLTSYDGLGHSVSMEELVEVKSFITTVLK